MPRIRKINNHDSCAGVIARMGEGIVRYSLYGIWGFSFLSVFVCLVWFALKYQYTFKAWEIVYVIPAIFLMLCVYWVGKTIQKLSDWKIFLIMSGIEAIFALIVIFTFNTQPCADYRAIWDTAVQFAAGDYSAGKDPTNYMYMYNWQIGITYFESLIIRVFGRNFSILKILNTIIVILTDWCIYLFCKRKAG